MSAAHRRHDFSDQVWERLRPLLPGAVGKRGRPDQGERGGGCAYGAGLARSFDFAALRFAPFRFAQDEREGWEPRSGKLWVGWGFLTGLPSTPLLYAQGERGRLRSGCVGWGPLVLA